MTSAVPEHGSVAHWHRRALAALLSIVLVAAAMVVLSPAARAIVPGIDINLLHDGQVIDDDAILEPGDEVLLRIQYNDTGSNDIAGTEITIELPPGISAPSLPSGNQAIQAIEDNDDGTITVRFHDPIPADSAIGALALGMTISADVEPGEFLISWQVGDSSGSATIVVEEPEEEEPEPPYEVTEGWNKSVDPGDLHSYFEFEIVDGEYVFTGLHNDILDRELDYTLRIDSEEARTEYLVQDQLPAGFGYIEDSISAELRTYNPQEDNEHEFIPTFDDDSFSGTVSVPENSTLFIDYKVEVTDKEALEASILGMFEDRGYGPGWAQISRQNTATFGEDVTRTASVWIGGSVPGVGIGDNGIFSKTGDRNYFEVITDEDGVLESPAQMTYTFRADLTPWTGESNNLRLTENVVISDVLIDQASWNTEDDDFITVSGPGPIESLSGATGFDGSVEDFAADQYVGHYAVDGQRLLTNVGRDHVTDVAIDVKPRSTDELLRRSLTGPGGRGWGEGA